MSQTSGSCCGPCKKERKKRGFFSPSHIPTYRGLALWCWIVSLPSQQWHTVHHQAVLTELHFQQHLLHDYYSAALHLFKLVWKINAREFSMWAINLPRTSRKPGPKEDANTRGGERSKSTFFPLYHNLSYKVLSEFLLFVCLADIFTHINGQCRTLMKTKHIKKSPQTNWNF